MSVTKTVFGKMPCGKDILCYSMRNSGGMEAQILTYGLRVHKLMVPDKNGNLGDVVLGYDNIEQYFGADYQGTLVGRYANRIGGAEFEIDGKKYTLDKNDGNNTLHGGPHGYHSVLWDVENITEGDEPSITFTHSSPDGDEGYPGNLTLHITYTLKKDNALCFEYKAVCDKKTPFNPTNHSFFNLSGDHSKKVLDTVLNINASCVTEVRDDLIPTGKLLSVDGTPLDFRKGKALGTDMFSDEASIKNCGGFDHNFCVDGEGFRLHASAYEPDSGRYMEVYSDMPGIQLYTFNSASGAKGKNGVAMADHTALCLETQFYPDSVHHSSFPFKFMEPGVEFVSHTMYKFSVK